MNQPLVKASDKPKWIVWGLLVLSILYVFFSTKTVMLSGETMGTTYFIKADIPRVIPLLFIEKQVKSRLDEIDALFSTYRDDSELMRLNQHESQDPFKASSELISLLNEAKFLHHMSEGAWDPTVFPLIELWGLYSDFGEEVVVPSEMELDEIKKRVDFDLVEIHGELVIKENHEVFIDLSSIAKGYGADQIGSILTKYRSNSYFIEIGGEVLSKGLKKDGRAYVVGINTPDKDASPYDVFMTVEVLDEAVATSGSYRRFRLNNGKTVSHIINPKTGQPIETSIVSVTVKAPTCSMADGLATACMVLGKEKSLALIESLIDTEVCIIETNQDEYKTTLSSGFKFSK